MESKEFRIVVTFLVPKSVNYDGKTGGLVRLAEILERPSGSNKMEVVLISSDESYADYFRENNVSIKFRPVKSKLKFKSLLGLCLKSLIILAKSFFILKLDFLESKNRKVIIYSSSDLFWEVIPAYFFKTRKKSIKWVQVIHHIYPDWRKRPGRKAVNFFGYYLQGFSFWLIRKKADKIIVLNNIVKNDLMQMSFSENKIFVSSNGIDINHFENMEKAELVYDGVFLARLSYSKGIIDLIEIWKNVCRELSQAKLAVIGGGSKETKNFLIKKINDFNLKKNIDLLGFLEDDEAYPILKSGKVFLFPSHEEGWGVAIAEAMACGLPVVSWDLPTYEEIFGNYTMQIKENDVGLFSKKTLDFLKDEEKRREFGGKGKEFIKKYSWDNVAEKELEIIKS